MTKLLGNLLHGLVFVISAPAGTGKSTLVDMLIKEFPNIIVQTISYTTRPRRSMEIPGEHYFFITEEEFQEKILRNEFLEYAEIYGNHYGTSIDAIEKHIKNGKHVILVIDTQGAMQLKAKIPAVFIFLMPPSEEILRMRLSKRKTETEAVIEKRVAWSQKEIEMLREYDYCVVNDDLAIAYETLKSIIIAEEHRTDVRNNQRKNNG